MSPDEGKVEIADIIDACDVLADRLDQYLEQLRSEQDAAEQSEDPRYSGRVTRGIGWTQDLLDTMDDVYERVGALRHNHTQLNWAREGMIV